MVRGGGMACMRGVNTWGPHKEKIRDTEFNNYQQS